MRNARLLPRDMVMIPDLVRVVGVEVVVPDVALSHLVEVEGEPVVPLHALLVVLECHCLRLEPPLLLKQPLAAILPIRE